MASAERERPESAEDPRGVPADPDCELCQAAEFTTWFHSDDICWVAECDSCDDPMVVWRHHRVDPGEFDLAHMRAQLTVAADQVFGDAAYRIDTVRRSIPDHWHAHARIDRFSHLT